MTKTKINFRDPKTNKRKIGCLDNETKKVSLANGVKYCLSYLKKKDANGIGFFETYDKGKKIQNIGEYK